MTLFILTHVTHLQMIFWFNHELFFSLFFVCLCFLSRLDHADIYQDQLQEMGQDIVHWFSGWSQVQALKHSTNQLYFCSTSTCQGLVCFLLVECFKTSCMYIYTHTHKKKTHTHFLWGIIFLYLWDTYFSTCDTFIKQGLSELCVCLIEPFCICKEKYICLLMVFLSYKKDISKICLV